MTPDEREAIELEKRQEEADNELHDALKKIFKKPIQNLSDDDKRFLQARREYLSKDEKDTYADILKAKLPRPDGKDVEEEKEIEELTRKQLEEMATGIGISAEDQKKARKNEDLQNLIKQKQEEIAKAEKGE